jgi:hypothetical protein
LTTKIHCDICGVELYPPSDKVPPERYWNQIVFTRQGSLDLCPDHLSLITFAVDKIIGDKEQLKKYEEEWNEAKRSTLQAE